MGCDGTGFAINEYDVATSNSPKPVKHQGFEYGMVLQGELQITVDGAKHVLSPGDLIILSINSSASHLKYRHQACSRPLD